MEALAGEIERLRPAELIVDEDQPLGAALRRAHRVTRRPPWHFDIDSARDCCARNSAPGTWRIRLRRVSARRIAAAGALLQYVSDTQKAALPHLQSITVERRDDAVIMDGPTRRNLELEESLSGHPDTTLAGVMDHCQSPMGSRLLRRWIQRPIARHVRLEGALPGDRVHADERL